MTFTYGSVCSGIEAATCAWHPLGWEAAFYSEIEAFPRAVLKHHYPSTPLHGDFTTIKAGEYEPIDLLVGGTPCQSFSVAGLRGGLSDDRGNLALEFFRLAQRLRPRWLVWENVPGVLSSWSDEKDQEGNPTGYETNDFDCFLGGLAELGYGFAYRILDAQYFGVPQRRRRVFVVAYLGDPRPAAAVLFERDSLQRNTPPRRQTREDVAAGFGASSFGSFSAGDTGTLRARNPQSVSIADSSPCLTSEVSVPLTSIYAKQAGNALRPDLLISQEDTARCLLAKSNMCLDPTMETYVTSPVTMRMREGCAGGGKGPLLSEDQSLTLASVTNDQVLFAPISFDAAQITISANRTRCEPGLPVSTLAKGSNMHVAIPVGINGEDTGFALRANPSQSGDKGDGGINTTMVLAASVCPTIGVSGAGFSRPGNSRTETEAIVSVGMSVRRLTPVECERLQGFSDDYTLIPWRGKPASDCPDGPRYKALGNSMAVPVMAWIGQRIQTVENVLQSGKVKGIK